MSDLSLSPPAAGALVSTLLVVDDHELIRLGLRALLAQRHDIRMLEARTLQEALDLLSRHTIERVLLDLQLPDAHGLTGLNTLRRRFPRTRVVILSGSGDPLLARRALAEGAEAFMPKSGDLRRVLDHLTGEPSGNAPVPAPASPRNGDPRAQLSPRQAQVLDWVLAGQSNRDIAERLALSEGTVKNHVSTLLLIFGARSRAELICALR